MKTRLKGAQKGHSLLKKKSDALTARFRGILKEIVRVVTFSFHILGIMYSTKSRTVGVYDFVY